MNNADEKAASSTQAHTDPKNSVIDFGSPMTHVLDVSRDDDSSSRDTFESPEGSLSKLAWDVFTRFPRLYDEPTRSDETPTSDHERPQWAAYDKAWEEYAKVLDAVKTSSYTFQAVIAHGITNKYAEESLKPVAYKE